MTEDDIRRAYLEDLIRVAPDLDPAEISGADHLQDDLELDSMDVLNLVIALSKRFSIEIPEVDYPQIATLDLAAAYIAAQI
ncbi:acyl carrier protein [Celeribacter neptunius]|uniref:Acyl carrier protein n=1 Tax=Celeribacter neptunius TaxID=588602 RepID=A0A1I3JYS1_9RHOB|nr:phosphopantetheine-binding protein [Celeribacter neptunius]SFI65085.1 acyl carrier protein [Celeribacter neptunius]